MPLMGFSASSDSSEHEVRDKRDPVIFGSADKACSTTGEAMATRKAHDVKSAWVFFRFATTFRLSSALIKA